MSASRARAAVVVAGLLAGLLVPALAAPAQAAQPSDCTVLGTLATASHARALRGAAAVAALGTDLPAAAAVNHMSATALQNLLTKDATSRLDHCGRLFFEDNAVDGGTPAADTTTPTTEAAATLDSSGDALALASRPGSARTIYLDFLGFALTGTQWNSSYSLPSGYQLSRFDTDANPSSFSANELAQIKSIWLRVAEDYAPFDVNVTTADPGLAAIDRSGAADLVYGTRAVITNDTTIIQSCGCGGIAYVNVFGATVGHETVQPALVFVNNLGRDTKAIAEAAAHEVGHNFGLHHDGQVVNGVANGYYAGQGSWAPIMGNSYGSPLTQWSKGEYAGATNTEDDLAIIAANAPYVTDEAGTSQATAPGLATGSTVGGVIAGATDTDFYAVTSLGGDVTVAVAPQSVSADLDVHLAVYNPDGTLRTTVDPATPGTLVARDTVTGLAATWTATDLPAGRYVVAVSGTGAGSPTSSGYSAYGSIGRYSVSTTIAGTPTLGVVTPALPDAVVGTTYAAQLAADHADSATTWTVVGGALPDGLALDAATGGVGGTPTAPGTSSITVGVAEPDGHYATRAYTLPVYSQVGIATTALAGASYGRAYSTRLVATGGDAKYVFTRIAGSLPRGLALSSGGVLSGTPTVTGRYAFTVAVTDDGSTAQLAGRTAVRAYSVSVTLPVRIATTSLAKGYHGHAYATRVYAAGGTGIYTWSRVAGAFPRGITLSSTGRITGRTAAHGRFGVTLRVRDSQGRTSAKAFTLTIV